MGTVFIPAVVSVIHCVHAAGDQTARKKLPLVRMTAQNQIRFSGIFVDMRRGVVQHHHRVTCICQRQDFLKGFALLTAKTAEGLLTPVECTIEASAILCPVAALTTATAPFPGSSP